MSQIAIGLDRQVEQISRLHLEFPELAPALGRKNLLEAGGKLYGERIIARYLKARGLKCPSEPKTIPDQLVSIVLHDYFSLEEASLKRVEKEHSLAMAAEGIAGNILENYLAEKLEVRGWIWCAGSVVKKVDFFKPPESGSGWLLLQVKNRDNSENSSSQSVRDGTIIQKWFRTFAHKAATNWDSFPDPIARAEMSEASFLLYARGYLARAKASRLSIKS